MADNSTASSGGGGVGCLTLLGLIFITLKLLGKIDWSWFWVLSPFWIGALFVALLLLGIVAIHVKTSK